MQAFQWNPLSLLFSKRRDFYTLLLSYNILLICPYYFAHSCHLHEMRREERHSPVKWVYLHSLLIQLDYDRRRVTTNVLQQPSHRLHNSHFIVIIVVSSGVKIWNELTENGKTSRMYVCTQKQKKTSNSVKNLCIHQSPCAFRWVSYECLLCFYKLKPLLWLFETHCREEKGMSWW